MSSAENLERAGAAVSTDLVGLATAAPRYRTPQEKIHRFLARAIEHTAPVRRQRAALRILERVNAVSGIESRNCCVRDYGCDDPAEFEFYPANWSLAPFPTTKQRMQTFRRLSQPLVEEAARKALDQAQVKPEQVTHLVFATCTGLAQPGPDILLMQSLGMRPNVARQQLGFMGCYASLNSIQAAEQIVCAQPDAVVLHVSVETCTLHFQLGEQTDTLVANTLFADGAAAFVFAAKSPERESLATVRGAYSAVEEGTLDQMSWHPGDHGFEMTLSQDVPRTLHEASPTFVAHLCDRAGYANDELRAWAIHPGGRRIVEAIAESLQLNEADTESSLGVLREHGNMSSATIGFVLEREFAKRPRGTGPLAALAFGPGLTMEGVIFER